MRLTFPCNLCPSNGVFFDFDFKVPLSKTKGISASKTIRSAGAPGLIRPLGKPSNIAGFRIH